MRRFPVRSSSIRSLGYDSKAELLEVEYQSGGTYRYLQVPASAVRKLIDAPSLGKFINAEIKPHYRCQRVALPRLRLVR